MNIEIVLIILGFVVAISPLLGFKMVKKKKIDFAKRITTFGWFVFIVLFVFAAIQCYLVFKNKVDANKREANESQFRTDTILNQKMLNDSISTIHLTLKNAGLKIQNGRVLPLKINFVTTIVDGIQNNNSPNYGVQAGRDLTISSERQFIGEEKEKVMSYINESMIKYNLRYIKVFISMESNGAKYKAQLVQTLQKAGYSVQDFGAVGYYGTILSPKGLNIKINEIDSVMNIDVGVF
jgi:tryptophan-rich sensory protein